MSYDVPGETVPPEDKDLEPGLADAKTATDKDDGGRNCDVTCSAMVLQVFV